MSAGQSHTASAPLNRLAKEPSPYLRQHATNPVDWWPWGDAAFAEARKRGVPVFLSIGYATCHWCHVMAHESFEDPEVARLMNDAFVNVKVDREERPDIDGVYMQACQMMTGSGGWPLTVLLTPDKKPFFAGTYFPKTGRHGRAGMMELVPRIQEAWQAKRPELEAQADHILRHLQGEEHAHDEHGAPVEGETDVEGEPGGGGAHVAKHLARVPDLGLPVLREAVQAFAKRFDAEHGGFGGAPKFPSAQNLLFLLRMHHRDQDKATLAMVDKTLRAMADAGVRDHLGGGFHRYSTDPQWLLPHFEKMLYDQAMLALAYTEADEATRGAAQARGVPYGGSSTAYGQTARSTLDYVLHDLQDKAGGFHCGEDADSEGEEGTFYVWTKADILQVLGAGDGETFCRAYGVTGQGNFLEEATRQRTGSNVLHLARPIPDLAKTERLEASPLEARLAPLRAKLLAVRTRRPRPALDDKVLTDWNGLIVAALAKGGRVLKEPRYVQAAERAGRFLLAEMMDAKGRLRHRYRAGVVDDTAFLDDHAYLLWGFIELYQTTFDPLWLGAAIQVAGQLEARFWDEKAGGFWQSPHDGEPLPTRRMEGYDGALPSGNGVAAWQLARLGLLTGDARWTELAERTVEAFADAVADHPHAFPALLCALDLLAGPTREVAVTPGPGADLLVEAARDSYRPRQVLLRVRPELAGVAAWTKDLRDVGGKSAAYVCENHACRQPVTDPAELRNQLA